MNSVVEDTDIRIEIDEELVSVVPDYLASRRLDCQVIEQLLIAGDLAGIQAMGHRLKGSGGSYGFDEISELGEVLECETAAGDTAKIRSVVERLKRYLLRVRVVYI